MNLIFDSIQQDKSDLDGVTLSIQSDPSKADASIGTKLLRMRLNGTYVRSISSSGTGIYVFSADDPIFQGIGVVEIELYEFDEDFNEIASSWNVSIIEKSEDSSPPPPPSQSDTSSRANEIAEANAETLEALKECICAISSSMSSLASSVESISSSIANMDDSIKALSDRGTNVNQGIVVRPANSEDWALQRAATISALREAFQLENVFDELQNPTDIPVQARSEEELESVPKRDDAITPQGNNAADYPDINQGGNAGTPVDLDEFKTPLDRTLEEQEENGSEDDDDTPEGVSKCHPL